MTMTWRMFFVGASILAVAQMAMGGILPEWQAIGDDASANAVVRCGAGQPPVRYGDLTRKGSVELPVAGPRKRVLWDFALPFDFTKADELSFDLRIDDLSGITQASMYLKSGDGWYCTSLPVGEEGTWQRIRWNRRGKFGVEGKPAGFHQIDAIRIAFERTPERKTTTVGVADFALTDATSSRVLVLCGETSAKRMTSESKAYRQYAATIQEALDRLGVTYASHGDDMVTAELFNGKAVVILPYNDTLSPEMVAQLSSFVERGGKIFALYSLPYGVGKLLGVSNKGFRRSGANGWAPFGGILRVGDGLEGQPLFAPQASGNANEPQLTGAGEVLATWGDAKHQSLGVPALVSTPTGIYMGHVWRPDGGKENDALLKAILGKLDPMIKTALAEAEAQAKALDEKRKAFVRSVPGKQGERRLVWCHSARGMGFGWSWDDSIRFLKENGFTDMIANLAWADCAFYDSKVVPMDKSVATQGDAFEECRAACRKYGIDFHVWRVCYNMGAHTDPERIAQYRKDGRLVQMFDAKAKSPWGTTFCPSHPENQRREIESMVELARKGADGIHFDYIRYADRNFCFCDGCRRRFESQLGRAVVNWPSDVRSDAELAVEWEKWRAETISTVVAETARRVRAEFPKVEISVAARADRDGAYSGDGQDWLRWAKEGWIDILCPMDYTDSTPFFRNICRAQRTLLSGTNVKLYPGIGLSCWKKDGAEAEKMTRHIQALRQDGFDGFTIFALDGRAKETFPLLHEGPTSLR